MEKGNGKALFPIVVFVVLYLGLGMLFEYGLDIEMGFYKIPVIVVFLVALLVACLQNRSLSLNDKLEIMGKGISNPNIITMIIIFMLAGIFVGVVICFDGKDATVVRKSASLFVDDVRRVTGQELRIDESKPGKVSARYAIIAGTIGKSEWIDALVSRHKIDTAAIAGSWERYMIEVVNNPIPGIKKAIVVAGSDRRGTAYGLLSISKAIGVSPWYWWADAPIKQQKQVSVKVDKFISKTPSVKFRGIFINDEDWGLYRWSKRNFEKERGNFGPRTYAKVCELLLRLQANYLCPAMHDASMAFHRIPENRLVADSFAIVMGSSHCEPLLFNTASEWKRDKMGEWDYINNKDGVNKVLKSRVDECAPFENVYTLALRGLHDRAMNADDSSSLCDW